SVGGVKPFRSQLLKSRPGLVSPNRREEWWGAGFSIFPSVGNTPPRRFDGVYGAEGKCYTPGPGRGSLARRAGQEGQEGCGLERRARETASGGAGGLLGWLPLANKKAQV